MGYVSKDYLSTQFQNFATRIATVFAKKSELNGKVDVEAGKGLSTNDFTNDYKGKVDNAVSFTTQTLTDAQKAQARANIGAGTGAEVTESTVAGWGFTKNTGNYSKPAGGIPKTDLASDVQTSLNKADNSLQNGALAGYATEAYVTNAIDALPEPMVFKGSLGVGGTISTLPAAAASNNGYTYKVITAGTYASQAAKVGDTFISDGKTWVLIPSGDEPSGTVTSVGMTVPTGLSVSGTPVTGSGTLAVTFASGYSIPTTAKQSEWDAKGTYSKPSGGIPASDLASGIIPSEDSGNIDFSGYFA